MNSRLILALLACTGTSAFARTVKGPSLSHETLLKPAEIGPYDGKEDDDDPPAPDVEVKKQRTDVNLLVPVKAQVLGGMFVLKLDFFRERRELSGPDAPAKSTDDFDNPGAAGLGAIYLPHAKEGAPRFFIVAARYGYLSFEKKIKPMGEYIVGVDIADDDLPFSLKLNADDETESRLLVRLRQFPGFRRYLLLAGHKLETKSGYSLDVHIPSHALFGWQTADAGWKFYFGYRGQSREYPFETDVDGTVRGWTEGQVVSGLVGVRRHLRGILYTALEAGGHVERLRYVTEDGEELAAHQTKLAPWARLSLETWVTTP